MPESRVDRHRKNKNEINRLRPSYCRRRLSKLQARENQTANTTDTTNGIQFFCARTRTETNAQETNTTLKGAFHSTTTLKMSTPGLNLAFTLPWGRRETQSTQSSLRHLDGHTFHSSLKTRYWHKLFSHHCGFLPTCPLAKSSSRW